ncbi:dihydrolipoyl dehydrogenase family protein [Peptococcus simiae]|uniref:Dihydrolipoyl dehydrogenase family protein n=1 Tax=Peptococcus simiae TaxID=1643805 RepID=A0ABW9GYY8_9FIRM
MMKKYDVIVIGTGSGNIILEAALKKGLSCAQIERAKFGGTCLTRGCIPTKVMVTAADRLYEIRDSGELGIEAGAPKVNWEVISQRVWQKIDESKDLHRFYLNEKNLDVYEGEGYFTGDHTLKVRLNAGGESEEITAPKIYIGVGGRTNIPEIEGLDQVPYATSEDYFGPAWPDKPYKDVIVIGGGAIGCEFAHIFRAFGAKVQLVQHNVRLLPKSDEEMSAAILNNLRLDGITVYLNKKTPKVKPKGDGLTLTIRDRADDSLTDIDADLLFICPGIIPNSDSLALKNTNIETNSRGWIPTNEFLETSVEGVYAFGDINGLHQFRHKANYEADILAHNHFLAEDDEDRRWARYDLVPAVTYTHPEVADVGLTEAQAIEAGHQVRVGRWHYYETAKGFALGYNPDSRAKAFAKLIVDAQDGTLLGAHAIGPYASALIQPYLNLMNAGPTPLEAINEVIASPETEQLRSAGLVRDMDPHKLRTVRETMVPHPSLSEVGIWPYYDLEAQEDKA